MHLSSVDLNLLVVLNALLETQSIKAAATRLSLSPSATSHALGRLRDQFDDQLLIRAGKKMVPTTRARFPAETGLLYFPGRPAGAAAGAGRASSGPSSCPHESATDRRIDREADPG
ncbi:MAG: LysR family transcriptional regulator, partial [Myxococcota bacterium]